MNPKQILLELKKELSKNTPVDIQQFGKSETLSIWVPPHTLLATGTYFKKSPFKLNWLENLCIVDFDSLFVFSYFLRSTFTQDQCVLRTSLPITSSDWIEFPSVQSIWSMSIVFEESVSALFGIRFTPSDSAPRTTPYRYLATWQGFPMRASSKVT